MGMDLATHAFTAESEKYDPVAIKVALDTITDDWIEANAYDLDPAEIFEPSEFRSMIEEGAEDYLAHIRGMHRAGNYFEIPGSDAEFHIAGGGSHGDEPYEGWTALGVFLTACCLLPELGTAAGFIGYGIVV